MNNAKLYKLKILNLFNCKFKVNKIVNLII